MVIVLSSILLGDSFMKQSHTRHHLQISLPVIQRLLDFFSVSAPFFDYIHGFGRRADEIGEDYVGYRRIESPSGDTGVRLGEINPRSMV